MCGRYVSVQSDDTLVDEFGAQETLGEPLPPSWNVAPTDPVRTILERRPKGEEEAVRQLRTVRWGLVPSWARDRKGGAKMINARIETVTSKPAFKAAAGRRRCLLPSAGYYEWQNTDQGKVPWFLHDPDGSLLAMAGLYELWRDPALADDDPGRWLWTCTVVTRPATDVLGHIHDRTPVVVPAQFRAAWLDCTSEDPQTARALLDRVPETRLEPTEVDSAVNSVRNNGPELVRPVARPTPQSLF